MRRGFLKRHRSKCKAPVGEPDTDNPFVGLAKQGNAADCSMPRKRAVLLSSLPTDNILFCDNHLLVVDKPAEIATQPDLVDLAKAWVKKKFNKPGAVFLEPIHRLDKPVAGVVLFARTSKALSRLQEQMRERKMEKIYEAWVEGCPKEMKGELRHLLVHGSFRAEISPEGKEAILEYEVLKKEKSQSQLRIVLHTGRYHQIRAQMAAIGCPVLGDVKYGSRHSWKNGIALYAKELSFEHPVTHEQIIVKSRKGFLQSEQH